MSRTNEISVYDNSPVPAGVAKRVSFPPLRGLLFLLLYVESKMNAEFDRQAVGFARPRKRPGQDQPSARITGLRRRYSISPLAPQQN